MVSPLPIRDIAYTQFTSGVANDLSVIKICRRSSQKWNREWLPHQPICCKSCVVPLDVAVARIHHPCLRSRRCQESTHEPRGCKASARGPASEPEQERVVDAPTSSTETASLTWGYGRDSPGNLGVARSAQRASGGSGE